MVGMNFNGVVTGNELRQITQEIFGKAQGSGSKVRPQKNPTQETPQQVSNLGKVAFSRSASKSSKAGFKQSNVEINESLQSTIKSKAAIDRYGQLSFKNSNEKERFDDGLMDLGETGELIKAYATKKDGDGKNPFSPF